MRTMKVNLENNRCDEETLKKRLMMLEGVIDVEYDVKTNLAYLKLSDKCSCKSDDVLCAARDLAYNPNSNN